jgi:hypothetical protein
MPLQFPDIASTNCRLFRSCGKLTSSSDIYLHVLRKAKRGDDEWLRSSTRVGGTSLIVLAAFGGTLPEPTGHVHIDVARRELFKKEPPGIPTPITSIREIIAEVEGQELDVDFEAHFAVATDTAPGLIRATKFEMRSGSLSLSTKAVALSVEGAPIYGISWFAANEAETIVVVEARTKITIDDSYLVKGFDLLSSAFNTFVIGANDG